MNDDQEELDDIKYQIELKEKAFNAQRERETATKLGAIPNNSKVSSSYTSMGATEKYGANKQNEDVDEDRSKQSGAVAADKQLKIDIPTNSWNTDNLLEPPLFSPLRSAEQLKLMELQQQVLQFKVSNNSHQGHQR